jgi:pyridoxal/pyridoxine/pyridoxamine kinase
MFNDRALQSRMCLSLCAVMGDEGRLYVKPELVDAYRATLIPLASVVVPNQYEAELLTQAPIRSLSDGLAACRKLHSMGPHTVVRVELYAAIASCTFAMRE